ncbi:phosphate ABC transporter substrate-binding protein [Sphingomonas sp. Root710]|uniref:substrate-binding domain-containing protein n=1 Tax=Sphingomonas sp. Root710 TaxID=1736594 RepID=UPI0006FE3A0C|nr:substrate-binding domain-containing protein [Sphingomonas sp. Root710]KRB86419.1 phosphate ABC transporter substrate-binding protein [Sphingomonas sp. Root710]
MHIRYKALALAAVGLACFPTVASARSQIRAVGSSTVYPFATAVAERLARANPAMKPPVIESTGTGGGIKLFCAGVGEQFPDIANASRRIKAGEVKTCQANGVKDITEIQVGIDGIALATAKATGIANVTSLDIYKALAKTPFGKPNKAKTWKDVNGSLPATPIRAFGPPPTSGTRDAFGELIMTAGCSTNPAMVALKKSDENKFKAICTAMREDGAFVETGENDNLIVQKLESNPGTVGIFGYSYLEENEKQLKGISINGVAPTYDSIASFKYPGARPLYVYVKNAHVRAIPAIRAYITEFTKEAAWGPQGYLVKRGMIAAPTAIRAKAAAAARALTPLNPAEVK